MRNRVPLGFSRALDAPARTSSFQLTPAQLILGGKKHSRGPLLSGDAAVRISQPWCEVILYAMVFFTVFFSSSLEGFFLPVLTH